MASTTNPFVAGLQSFAADPEGEAKGRYITANTAKTQHEADILASRKAWREKFGLATDITPTAKAGELSNDKVDAGAAYAATGTGSGQKMLFDTDPQGNLIPKKIAPTARDVGLASLLLSKQQPGEVVSRMLGSGGFDKPLAAAKTDYKLHEYSDTNTGIHYRQLANADGSPRFKANGEPEMAPLNPNTVKTTMPGAAGGQVLQTSQAVGGAPVTTALNLSGSRMIDPNQLTQAIKIAHASDAKSRGIAPTGMNDLEFLIAKKIGHIDGTGKKTEVPMLNPDEVQSIQRTATWIMSSDPSITLSEATAAAIDSHPDIAKGNIVNKDYDNKGFFDNFLGLGGSDNEKDAAGIELPQYGGSREYSTSKDYVRNAGTATPDRESRGRYSNIKGDSQVVPLAARLAGDAVNETGIPQIMAGATGRPEFATKLQRDPTTKNPISIEVGKFYHEEGKFYVGDWGPNGTVRARLITNIKK